MAWQPENREIGEKDSVLEGVCDAGGEGKGDCAMALTFLRPSGPPYDRWPGRNGHSSRESCESLDCCRRCTTFFLLPCHCTIPTCPYQRCKASLPFLRNEWCGCLWAVARVASLCQWIASVR